MIVRAFWREQILAAWRHAAIVWLTGPRRVGKTVLVRSLEDAEYLNCDLPSVARVLEDAERFFGSLRRRHVIFDEVHQLPDPSRLLKIGADAFGKLRILATGSSTLAATQKFRDSLAGRKRVVELVPVLYEELTNFGIDDLQIRLLRGGLPPALLGADHDPGFYAEWLDSYFARDVQELFRIGKRSTFLRALELLLRNSGGMLSVTKLASESQASRPTIMSWLDVWEITHTIRIVRPFSGGGRREIVAQPKVYGFDTGFVCHARGWDRLRPEDCGLLWEHVVLETLVAGGLPRICYWRDKQQREVDFLVPRARGVVDAVECKWHVSEFATRGLSAFREGYPKGRNFLVVPGIGRPYERRFGDFEVTVLSPDALRQHFAGA